MAASEGGEMVLIELVTLQDVLAEGCGEPPFAQRTPNGQEFLEQENDIKDEN